MKFYIPEIGDHIVLTEDWSFDLYAEVRNRDLAIFNGFDLEYFGHEFDYIGYRFKKSGEVAKPETVYETIPVTIPKGTILAIDRIYIRKGASDYSSITFFAKNLGEVIVPSRHTWCPSKPRLKKSLRFWAKLAGCNNIQFDRTEKI